MKKNMDIHKQKYPSDDCPSYEKLVSYVNFTLNEDEFQDIENHLESCEEDCMCKVIVEGMEVEQFTKITLEKEPEIAEGINHQAIFNLIEKFSKPNNQEEENNGNIKKKSA